MKASQLIKTSVLLASLFAGELTLAKALIVEYAGKIENHGQNIEDILCHSKVECDSVTISDFWGTPFANLERGVLLYRPTVINFSFAIQQAVKPQIGRFESLEDFAVRFEKYEEGELSFQKEIANLESLMQKSPQTLFAVASGNGVFINPLQSLGVALGDKNILYPTSIEAPNKVTVAALDSDRVETSRPENILLADYSNYGLTTVDVAAPVLKNKKGEILKGTSYAAPYIAHLGHQLALLGKLSPVEIKEILIKSSYVKNIEAAISASQDLISKGSQSLTYKAMYDSKRKNRLVLQKQLGDIILVRSGGPVVADVALWCAQLYLDSNKNQSITTSCLQAHQEVLGAQANDAQKLQLLWQLRGL